MKTIITIFFAVLSISTFSQDQTKINNFKAKKIAAKTAIEQEEHARMELNFKEISPDTLDFKKQFIFIAKKDSNIFCYMKIKNKCYKINWLDANVMMEFNSIYNIRFENDSIVIYGDKGVKLFSIQ
jgi:hypothetical protein